MSSAVIQSFLLHLCNVRNWFLTQTKYAFFASSLLLIYDADSLLKSPFTNEGLDSCLMHNSVLSSPHLHSDHGISDATISKLEDFELDTSTLSKINSGLENISKVSVVTEGVGRGHSIMLKATSCEEDEQRKASSEIFNLTDVRMIDFAHVFDSSSQDENYLHGLNNLISILEFLLKEAN